MLLRLNRKHLAGLASAMLATALGAALLNAENGRNLVATYQIRDAINYGTIVKFDLHVKVFNYSGSDVTGATLALSSRQIAPLAEAAEYQGSFSDVSIPYRKSVDLDGAFAVPAREFHQWQHAAPPNLVATYIDEEGNPVRTAVEMRAETVAPKGDSR